MIVPYSDPTRGEACAPADRFILIPIPVSVLDVREHFRQIDPDSPVTPEEMSKLTKLALELVPVCTMLEYYAKLVAGKPVFN